MLSVVRVNKLDETLILRTLDQVASAVLIPFVITVPKSNWKSAPANTHRTESRE
jgi:2-keto-3-deoxy-L-rhamnonate aldolase RhmA